MKQPRALYQRIFVSTDFQNDSILGKTVIAFVEEELQKSAIDFVRRRAYRKWTPPELYVESCDLRMRIHDPERDGDLFIYRIQVNLGPDPRLTADGVA